MDEPLKERLGQYALLELIGKGGMAEVYRAQVDGPAGFVKDLALKRILPHYANHEQLIQRFFEEARIAAAMNHGNVLQVTDFGRVEGQYYIVMEYVDGMSLATVLDRCAQSAVPLPSIVVAYVGAKACAGLAYAHQLTDRDGRRIEIVHRDVSPQNIMLSYNGDVKIGDFGIAKAADSLIRTEAGLRVGKTSYMSPEQASGEPLDGRSDLFALGVTLWEALTLKPLVPRADPATAISAITRCEFPPPSSENREVPEELDEIVMQVLTRNREDRYPDGEAMARRLRAYVHHNAPGYGRHDLVDFLDWLRPDGSRPSTLAPPAPVAIPAHPSSVPHKNKRTLWAIVALIAAPFLGLIVGGVAFATLYFFVMAAGAEGGQGLPARDPAPAPVVAPQVPPPPTPPDPVPTPFPQPAITYPAPMVPAPPPAPPDGGAQPLFNKTRRWPGLNKGPKPPEHQRSSNNNESYGR